MMKYSQRTQIDIWFSLLLKKKKNTKYQFSNENAIIKCSDNVIIILKYIFYVPSYLCLETTY